MEFVLRDNSANNHLYCNYSDETETKTNSTEANIEILRVFTLFARERTHAHAKTKIATLLQIKKLPLK